MPPDSGSTLLSAALARAGRSRAARSARSATDVPRQAEVAAVDQQVLADGQLDVEGVLLRARRRAGRGSAAPSVRGSRPSTRSVAVGDRRDAADHAHRRGLAGAVGAEEAERLAAVHVDVDAVDRGEVAEALHQPAGVDQRQVVGGAGHVSPPYGRGSDRLPPHFRGDRFPGGRDQERQGHRQDGYEDRLRAIRLGLRELPRSEPRRRSRMPRPGRRESRGHARIVGSSPAKRAACRAVGGPGRWAVTADEPLAGFSPATRAWFDGAFQAPTPAQAGAWQAIAPGDNALVVAPTGSGKTLAAFLWSLDRLASAPRPDEAQRRCRVLYISPLKALAVDVERNLRAPLTGIRQAAARLGLPEPDLTVGDPLRRHPGRRAAPVRPHAARHPHHDARVAVPDPHLPGPRVAARRRDGDRRRGARRRRHQARRPPRALPRAARRAARPARPADRPVRDGPPGRRGRPVPRRRARRRGRAAAVDQDRSSSRSSSRSRT